MPATFSPFPVTDPAETAVVRTYIVRGLLAGIVAALAAFGFALLVGEPQIDRAVALEEAGAHQRRAPAEPVVVSREVQTTIGLATGLVVAGAALGGLFSLAFAVVYRRFADAGARATALAVAGTAFIAVFVVPFLKYPANPPAVGNPATIGHRTALYFTLLVFSLVSLVVSVACQRRLLGRFSPWKASLTAAATYLALIAAAYVILPGVDEVAGGFPATLLWRFRVASAGIQCVLWVTIGLAFGSLTERSELGAARSRSDLISAKG